MTPEMNLSLHWQKPEAQNCAWERCASILVLAAPSVQSSLTAQELGRVWCLLPSGISPHAGGVVVLKCVESTVAFQVIWFCRPPEHWPLTYSEAGKIRSLALEEMSVTSNER